MAWSSNILGIVNKDYKDWKEEQVKSTFPNSMYDQNHTCHTVNPMLSKLTFTNYKGGLRVDTCKQDKSFSLNIVIPLTFES